jgi:ubiquitin carboxyl-terminal hydrolase 8
MNNFDLSRYTQKGFEGGGKIGIVNLGNTCFVNACIQVLNHTYELNDLFMSGKHEKHMKNIPDSTIITEWLGLQSVMWANTGSISPNKFIYHVHQLAKQKDREIFTGFAQNDMPEFLLFVIECMHNSISRPINMRISGNIENKMDKMAMECYKMLQHSYNTDYSEIMEMFYGIYVSQIVSLDGRTIHTSKPENYFILDLPIPLLKSHIDLYDCFTEFTKAEILEGDNAWFNENTQQKEDIQKRITFWNFPKVVVITLRRFSPCGTHKRNDLIQFPVSETLDLSQYVTGYNPEQYKYELFGVCNHMGGVQGGHYNAIALNFKMEWILYDDQQIQQIVNEKNIVSPLAYCLFYRKK